jgi:hypothetical protein
MAKNVKDAYSEILRLRNEFYQKWQEADQYDDNRGAYKAKYKAFDKALELLTPSVVDPQPEEPIEYNPFDDFRHTDSEEPISENLDEEDSFDELLQKLYIKYNKEVSLEKLLDIASNFVKWQKVQMIKSAELDGWIARDEDDRLHLFEVEPRRLEKEHRWWDRDYHRTGLDESDFPDLKWEDEPVYVKLPIIVED